MVIDIDLYKVNKDFVMHWFRNNKGDPMDGISILACSTGCPCIVIAFWLGEFLGWPQEVVDRINGFITFYGYRKILNIPEDCPKLCLN